MATELMDIQNKIAMLEKKLNKNQLIKYNNTASQESLDRTKSDHGSTKTGSRLEINLDNHIQAEEENSVDS